MSKIDVAFNKVRDDHQDRLIQAQYAIANAVAKAKHVMDDDEIREWVEAALKDAGDESA